MKGAKGGGEYTEEAVDSGCAMWQSEIPELVRAKNDLLLCCTASLSSSGIAVVVHGHSCTLRFWDYDRGKHVAKGLKSLRRLLAAVFMHGSDGTSK